MTEIDKSMLNIMACQLCNRSGNIHTNVYYKPKTVVDCITYKLADSFYPYDDYCRNTETYPSEEEAKIAFVDCIENKEPVQYKDMFFGFNEKYEYVCFSVVEDLDDWFSTQYKRVAN